MSQENTTGLIKIKRILNDRESSNSVVRKEVINISDVKGFREWHKGKNDSAIEGDITLVILKSEKKDGANKEKIMLINEKWTEFEQRVLNRTYE